MMSGYHGYPQSMSYHAASPQAGSTTPFSVKDILCLAAAQQHHRHPASSMQTYQDHNLFPMSDEAFLVDNAAFPGDITASSCAVSSPEDTRSSCSYPSTMIYPEVAPSSASPLDQKVSSLQPHQGKHFYYHTLPMPYTLETGTYFT